jgi:hypothetical protein
MVCFYDALQSRAKLHGFGGCDGTRFLVYAREGVIYYGPWAGVGRVEAQRLWDSCVGLASLELGCMELLAIGPCQSCLPSLCEEMPHDPLLICEGRVGRLR